jgi:hypothetical protein
MMQRFAMMPLAAALTLALAAPGFGQATGASPPASPQAPSASGPAQAKPAQTAGQAPASTQATPPAAGTEPQGESSLQRQLEANSTQLQTHKKLEVIKVKGGMASAPARAKADAKLDAAAKKADADASAQGEAAVAARLAAEFGMSAEDLSSEHQSLGCSWGELMIARSLRAMSTTEVSVPQLLELRKDQIGWAQIAAGLDLKLGEAVAAVQAEERVAAGLVQPDGKVAAIHEGTRAHRSGRTGSAAAGGQTAAQAGSRGSAKVKP